MSTTETKDNSNTLFGFPLNRVVALSAPITSLIAGKIALWLFANVGLFSSINVKQETIAKALVQVFAFLVGAGVTYLAHHKFLTGWQSWEFALTAPAAPAVVTVVNDGSGSATVDDETDTSVAPPSDADLAPFEGEPPTTDDAPPVQLDGTPESVVGLPPEGDITKFGDNDDDGEEPDGGAA